MASVSLRSSVGSAALLAGVAGRAGLGVAFVFVGVAVANVAVWVLRAGPSSGETAA